MVSRYVFVVAMDYVDKSDVEAFAVKRTLATYLRENIFHFKLFYFHL